MPSVEPADGAGRAAAHHGASFCSGAQRRDQASAPPAFDGEEGVPATHKHGVRCPERLVHGGLGRRGARDVERPHVDAALVERLALLRAELLEVVRGGACVYGRSRWMTRMACTLSMDGLHSGAPAACV